MRAHISNIKTYKKFFKMTNVSSHFNMYGHKFPRDFSFFIFIKDCDDLNLRLSYEKQLIHVFNNLSKKLMNDEKDLNNNFNCLFFKNLIKL